MTLQERKGEDRLVRPGLRSSLRQLMGGRKLRHGAAALLVPIRLLGIGASGLSAGTLSPDCSELVTNTRPALVVLVSVGRHEKPKSFGTGFFITQDGVLVTARHVAQAEENLVAITQDGKRFPVTGFIGEDRDYDIAVLKIERSQCAHLRLANGMLRTNRPVTLVSAQDMIAPACSTGIVAAVISLPGLFDTVATRVPVRAGQSGSPLLNAEGDVVGVVPYVSPTESATTSPVAVIRRILANAGTNAPIAFRRRPTNGSNLPLFLDPDFKPAIAAVARADWRDAERRLKRVAKRFPESPFTFTALAMAQIQIGHAAQAQANVERAHQLSPDSALPYLLRGVCLVSRGEISEGLAPVRKALELGLPNHDTTCSAWELIEQGLGHNKEAEEALISLQAFDGRQAAEVRGQLDRIRTKTSSERGEK